MSQKWPFTLWLGFVSICLIVGQGSVPAKIHIDNPFFYELKKDGVTSYLFGTQHLGLTLGHLPFFITDALENSHFFLAEDLDNDSIAPDMSRAAKFELGLLHASTAEKLKRRGLNLEKLSHQDSILNVCVQYTFWDAMPAWHRIDKELEKLAILKQKKLIALDEAEFLNQALVRTTAACDLNRLTKMVSPEQAQRNFFKSFNKYLNGSESDMIADPRIATMTLMAERNANWLPKIALAHSKGAFVAVGVLHLFGGNGLIPALQKEGFVVTRVTGPAVSPVLAVSE